MELNDNLLRHCIHSYQILNIQHITPSKTQPYNQQ